MIEKRKPSSHLFSLLKKVWASGEASNVTYNSVSYLQSEQNHAYPEFPLNPLSKYRAYLRQNYIRAKGQGGPHVMPETYYCFAGAKGSQKCKLEPAISSAINLHQTVWAIF